MSGIDRLIIKQWYVFISFYPREEIAPDRTVTKCVT